MWTGRMRIIAVGDDCALHLEDSKTGELFAKCPYDLDGTSVEPVVDSSRYFVIKIVDPASGNHAFVGLGFPERSWAFDMNVALQDHVKRVRNARKAAQEPVIEDSGPMIDYSLKEGQKIQINLGMAIPAKSSTSNTNASAATFGFLPPPPKPGMPFAAASAFPSATGQQASQPSGAFGSSSGFDDFGDFASVPTQSSGAKQGSMGSTSNTVSTPTGWTTF
eukprot:jgi/Hompol1/3510/HPOL_003283-RA